MNKKLLLSLAVAVLMAAPAFASVQNVKVSGDVDSWYLNRQNFDFGQRATNDNRSGLISQSIFFTQSRLKVDADLSDNVSTTVRLLNERVWGKGAGSSSTGVDLDLANITLREFLYSPLTVTVGRQDFFFGNGLIIGGGTGTSTDGKLSGIATDLNEITAQDGIKAVLDYKPLTVSLIYINNGSGAVTGRYGANKDNSDVYGVNANYQLGDAMNTVVEAYLFSRFNGDSLTAHKGDTLYIPGLRVSTNPIKGLNTQAEVAFQGGNKTVAIANGSNADADSSVRRQAMSAQLMASYAIPVAELEKYKTVASASYTYVSGDKNASNARVTPAGTTNFANPVSGQTFSAWDPLFEGQGGGTIYNSLFDLTNMHIISASLQANPIQDVTAKFTWSNLMADKKVDGANALSFYQPDGTGITPNVTSRKNMGNEYDVNVDYAYTEDVTMGVSLGWYVPGRLFNGNNNSTASQALGHVRVNF